MNDEEEKIMCAGVEVPAEIYRDIMDRVTQLVEAKNPTVPRSEWMPKAEKKLARLVVAMRTLPSKIE